MRLIDAYWRAANSLSVGQIYLMDNPLLREPLLPEHVKPRLLGHWGTTPGLNLIYAHANRVIKQRDLDEHRHRHRADVGYLPPIELRDARLRDAPRHKMRPHTERHDEAHAPIVE